MATSSVAYNKPVLPRVSDTSDLASNRASVYSGKALDFDGVNDFVDTGRNLTFLNNGDFSYTVNAKFDILSGDEPIMGQGSASAGSANLVLINSVGRLRFAFYGDDLDWSEPVRTGVWYSFTFTYKRSTKERSIYVNGQLVASDISLYAPNASSNNFVIGKVPYSSTYADAQYTNVRVFSSALTAAQVAELYNNPEQILPTGVSAVNLKLWLPMMEGAGAYVYNGAAGSLGEELVSNGTVDEVCQKWAFTDNGYVSATGGKLVWNAPSGSGANAVQYLNIVAGRTYRVTFDYSVNRDGFSIVLGNANAQPTQTGTGTYTVDLTPTSTNSGYFSLNMSGGTGDIVGYMDNISVKEVVPQATGTISGATWVAGQGEPLPQTALIDWNKHNQFLTQSSYVTFSSAGVHNVGTFIIRHIPLEITDNRYFVGYGANQGQRNRNLGQYSGNYWFVGWGSGAQDTTTTATIDLGKDTTVAYSWDENYRIKLYKNGAKFMDETKTLSPVVNTNVYLQTPGDAYSSSTTFSANNITIYLAMYNRVLSEEEINDVYNGVVSPDSVSGCVHYWENSRAWVDTVGSVNGNEVGNGFPLLIPKGLTTGKDIFGNSIVTPRASGAFNFDLQSYVKGPTLGVMPTGNGSRTLEVWVYYKPNGLAQSLLEIGSGVASNGRFGILANPTNVGSVYIVGQANDNQFASIIIDSNQWTHLVATHDGTTLNVYKNGILSGTAGETYNTVDTGYTIGLEQRTSTPLSISSAYEWAESQVSNPRIYNYALTANQVADNFNQKASTFGKTKVTGELQAYINRTVADGATVEAHSALLNTLTELENK